VQASDDLIDAAVIRQGDVGAEGCACCHAAAVGSHLTLAAMTTTQERTLAIRKMDLVRGLGPVGALRAEADAAGESAHMELRVLLLHARSRGIGRFTSACPEYCRPMRRRGRKKIASGDSRCRIIYDRSAREELYAV